MGWWLLRLAVKILQPVVNLKPILANTALSTVTYLLAASLSLVFCHYLLVISYFLYFKFVTSNF